MKAMTIWQPYASLIAAGVKRFETRSFRPPAALIGQRIAIHAAARPCRTAELTTAANFLVLQRIGVPETLPRGVVVATAILDSVHRAEDIRGTLSAEELAVGGWYGTPEKPQRFGWLLRDVVKLDQPVPAKGKQGWWGWPS